MCVFMWGTELQDSELLAPCFYVDRNALHQRALSLFSIVRSVLMSFLAHVLPIYNVQFNVCNHYLPSITCKRLAS